MRHALALLLVPMLALGCSDDGPDATTTSTTVAAPIDAAAYTSAVTAMCERLAGDDEAERERAIGLFRTLRAEAHVQAVIDREVLPLLEDLEAAEGEEAWEEALFALRNRMGSIGYGECADALAR